MKHKGQLQKYSSRLSQNSGRERILRREKKIVIRLDKILRVKVKLKKCR